MNRTKQKEPAIRRSRTKTNVREVNKTFDIEQNALLQGKKHTDNPWIKAISIKEERSAKRFCKKLVTIKKKMNEGIFGVRDAERESDIIAMDAQQEIFKVGDKQDYHQLIKYDTWEHDIKPKEWVEKCKNSGKEAHGTSPVYIDNTYIWEPVKVISYSERLKKFQVLVLSSQQKKFVSRLSLMFYDEDHNMFRERLKQCRERRENVENELRFQNYVDSTLLSTNTHLPEKMLENILMKATYKEIGMNKKDADKIINQLTLVIDAIYRRAMRKCLVLQRSLFLNEMYKLDAVNVPVKLNETVVSKEALISVGRVQENSTEQPSPRKNKQDYKLGKLSEVRNKRRERKGEYIKSFEKGFSRYGSSTRLVNSFTDEFQRICENFKKNRLFLTDSTRFVLPMQCSEFIGMQDKKIKGTVTDMLNNWRFQIIYSMKDKIGKKFVFDVADKQKYEESAIRKLIHRCDLIMHNHLKEFYELSINDFITFMQSFTEIKANSIWKKTPSPLIEVSISCKGLDKKKVRIKDKEKHKGDSKRNKIIKEKEKALMFIPDIDSCKNDILSLFMIIIKTSQRVSILETEDFNVFLTDKKEPAIELTLETPLIANAYNTINGFIEESMIGPKKLLEDFKKYEYLMQADTLAIKKIMEKPRTSDELREELDKLSKAKYEIQTLAIDSVRFDMFQVNTGEIKEYLAQKAQKIKNLLFKAISKHCNNTVIEILNNYKKILTKLEDKPTSKEAYKELKIYLKNSDKRMEELKAQHELVRLKMELLEDNLVKIDKDNERNFWDVHQYPSKLRSKITRGNNNLLNYEEHIRIELENKKDQFDKDLNEYQKLFVQVINFDNIESAKKEYRLAFELHDKIEKALITAKEINNDESLLEMKQTEYNSLDKLKREFKPFYILIKLAEEIQMTIEGWKTNPFIGLEPSDIEKEIKAWNITLDDTNMQLNDYKDQGDVAIQLKEFIEQFTQYADLIKCLRSEAMKEEDFNEINKLTSLNLRIGDEICTLNTLIAKNANDHLTDIKKVWEKAERKLDLEKNLKRMKDEMNKKRIELIKHKNNVLIQNYKQLIDYLNEHMTILQTMLTSQYMIGALRKNCMTWSNKLEQLTEILEELSKCQHIWIYLEPIFSDEDIKLILKFEADQFFNVNSKFIQQMMNINTDNLLISLLDKERIKEDLVWMNNSLEMIMKSLGDYFEARRKKFPWFYFIDDKDLIKVLSQAKYPSSIQPCLNKCFREINTLILENNNIIVGVISNIGEQVKLCESLSVKEGRSAETWLKKLEDSIYQTMKLLAEEGIKDYNLKSLEEYIFAWPLQIVLIADQINFSTEIVAALKSYKERIASLKKLDTSLKDRIKKYMELIKNTTTTLNSFILESLILTNIHQTTIIQNLIDKDVESETEFDWLINLRYSFVNNTIKVNVLNSSLPYGYKLNANPSHIVITPLTDRCYRAVIVARDIYYGNAIIGPEGSGKTETIKALAQVMGVHCIVFRGFEEIEQRALINFFKGLVIAGAWCCFKEFNKIPLDLLSVIAMCIGSIQEALKIKEPRFLFNNEEIILNVQYGISITTNKSLDNLPESLKQLFRPCALSIPDQSLIAQVLFQSYGFQNYKELGTKLIEVFKLQGLGLYSIKMAVLRTKELRESFPEANEKAILKRVLDEINIPKLNDNIEEYKASISDLLTEEEIKVECEEIGETIIKEKLQSTPEFLNKCTQIYERLCVSNNVIIIGESLSGKTKAIKVASRALSSNDKMKVEVINPKTLTIKQLYGYLDSSQSWIHGVLSRILKDFSESLTSSNKFLIFDGPMDIEWMEGINTILDDNRELYLASGATISLDKSIKIMFEVENLKSATPGMINKCNIIYMQSLNWEIIMKKYCEELPLVLTKKRIKLIKDLMCSLLIPCIAFMKKYCKYQLSELHLIISTMKFFECFIMNIRKTEYRLPSDIDNMIQNAMIFSVIWGFTGGLEQAQRKRFCDFLFDLLNMIDINTKYKLEIEFTQVKFDIRALEDRDPLDLLYDFNNNQWEVWGTSIQSLVNDNLFNEIVVSTSELERINSLLSFLIVEQKHVVLIGPSNSGKSVAIRYGLKANFSNTKYTNFSVALSTRTTTNQVQYAIEHKLERCGVSYKPSQAKQAIIFIDDLHIPHKDSYGVQQPIELLRQWMDYNGWYEIDTKEKNFRYVTNVTFVGALPNYDSRNLRYLRHFNILYTERIEEKELTHIFTQILTLKFREGYESEVQETIPLIVENTMKLYKQIKEDPQLKPIPNKIHYGYNIHDIEKVMQGLLLANPSIIITQDDILKLWAHEFTRVFQDKLITDNDIDAFSEKLMLILKSNNEKERKFPLVFCDLIPADKNTPEYRKVLDRNLLKTTTEHYLTKYNEGKKAKLNLILFEKAIDMIWRIKRVLSIPAGHLLLLGIGSIGRKSLIELATFICGYELFTIPDNKNLEINEWKRNLRKVITMTGVERTPTVFLIGEDHVNSEYALEDLHNILIRNEVPNLFSKSNEKEDHLGKLRENLQSKYKKLFNNDEEIIETLKKHTSKILHIALYITPGNNFKNWIRDYASLRNCMTINYFSPWPKEGLRSIASQIIKGIEESEASTFIEMHIEAQNIANIYKSDGHTQYHITPSNYLEMLEVYKEIYEEQSGVIGGKVREYTNGVNELKKIEQFIAETKVRMQEIEPGLREKTEIAEQLADVVKKKRTEITEETKILKKEQESAEEIKKNAEELEDECKSELNFVLVGLKEAEKDMESISQERINSLAMMDTGGVEMKLIAKALCIILDIKPKKIPESTELDYWLPKKIFTLKNIKLCITTFNKESIPIVKATELSDINDSPDFSTEKVSVVSGVAEVIAKWIRAIINYNKIYREVEPKRKKLSEEMERERNANNSYQEKNKQLEEKKAILKELSARAKEAEDIKKKLVQDIEMYKKKMKRAREVIDTLKNDIKRWSEQATIMQLRYSNIKGDSIISSGIISYLGIFTTKYRNTCISNWSAILKKYQINFTENFSLYSMLGHTLYQSAYSRVHFPVDAISIENLIIMKRSRRWTMIIDPQLQALEWVREKAGLIEIDYRRDISLVLKDITKCMIIGVPALLKELPKVIDLRLIPLLKKKFTVKGSQRHIQFNDENINVGKGFVLYLITREAQLVCSSELCEMLTMVNFAVTEEGLEELLWNIIMVKEDPTTERNRNDVLYKSEETKRKLGIKEEELLKIITTNGEAIVESDRLLDALKTTKSEWQRSIIQIEEHKRISEKTKGARAKFRPIATHIAKLYFCITDLTKLNTMYQFSLDWYMNLYHKALSTKCAEDEKDKLEFYKHCFMELLITNTSKGLFEKDRLLFGLNLALKLILSEDINTIEEVHLLIKGFEQGISPSDNPLSQWMSNKAWTHINLLSQYKVFNKLPEEIFRDIEDWKQLYSSPDLLNPLLNSYNPLQRLLICIGLQCNKFIELVKQFVVIILGNQLFEYKGNVLEETLSSSVHKKPIMIITGLGVNPVDQIKEFALKRGITFDIIGIPLGQSQYKLAKSTIQYYLKQRIEAWVILKNCHLATQYLNTIEKLLEDIPHESKKDFRLWLTTLPSNSLPSSLIQDSLKVVSEKPKGIVRNLSSAISAVNTNIFNESGAIAEIKKKIVFSLCFFHAVMIERERYEGWNKVYDFRLRDLLTTIDQVLPLITEVQSIPWGSINFIIEEITYGAQIDHLMDRRMIKNLLNDYIRAEVLKDDYKFVEIESYQIPRVIKSRDDCLRFIKGFPVNDYPEIIGFSESFIITHSVNDGLYIQSMLSQIFNMKDQKEEGVIIVDLLKEIPNQLNIEVCRNKYSVSYEESLNVFLQQEVIKCNNLISTVYNHLKELDKALKGDTLMSKELEDIYYNIYNNTVPELWLALNHHTPLQSWIQHLKGRIKFLNNWIETTYPTEYFLGMFFNPQGFIESLKLNYARKKQIPVNTVTFEHKIIANPIRTEEGKYLSGLYIKGAKWQLTHLEEMEVGNIITIIPTVLFTPIAISKAKKPLNVSF